MPSDPGQLTGSKAEGHSGTVVRDVLCRVKSAVCTRGKEMQSCHGIDQHAGAGKPGRDLLRRGEQGGVRPGLGGARPLEHSRRRDRVPRDRSGCCCVGDDVGVGGCCGSAWAARRWRSCDDVCVVIGGAAATGVMPTMSMTRPGACWVWRFWSTCRLGRGHHGVGVCVGGWGCGWDWVISGGWKGLLGRVWGS